MVNDSALFNSTCVLIVHAWGFLFGLNRAQQFIGVIEHDELRADMNNLIAALDKWLDLKQPFLTKD